MKPVVPAPNWSTLPPEAAVPAFVPFAESHRTVILDDDPTGTQTVHGIPVLTDWTVPLLTEQLRSDDPAFFILTNARALPPRAAEELIETICRNLQTAASATGNTFGVILRGDSTLRGHFPTEPEAVERALGTRFDTWLICPFFEEGGRLTLGGVHYVREGETWVPAAETPFARDASFGYRSSDLRDWVEEKTGGTVRAGDVGLLSLEEIRTQDVEVLAERMRESSSRVWVADALTLRDARVVAAVVRTLERRGVRVLARTAASFVQAYLGIEGRPPLRSDELVQGTDGSGGLVVVGSYVPKTTAQLERLRAVPGLATVELDVEQLLDDAAQAEALRQATEQVDQYLLAGRTTVLFTSRKLIADADAGRSLQIGQRVSGSLVAVVRGLTAAPRFLIAKGGITSSDVATRGLGVRKALIAGQALPGVPVWRLGSESRFPGLAYVVFPGNVGSDAALADLVQSLDKKAEPVTRNS
jgi:uncharacterized protein YgbK (DUF1537 family)